MKTIKNAILFSILLLSTTAFKIQAKEDKKNTNVMLKNLTEFDINASQESIDTVLWPVLLKLYAAKIPPCSSLSNILGAQKMKIVMESALRLAQKSPDYKVEDGDMIAAYLLSCALESISPDAKS